MLHWENKIIKTTLPIVSSKVDSDKRCSVQCCRAGVTPHYYESKADTGITKEKPSVMREAAKHRPHKCIQLLLYRQY